MKELTSHIFRKHNLKAKDYRQLFPNAEIRCSSLLQKQSNRIKGSNNPAFQHGGYLSPFSEKFFKGSDNIEKVKEKAKSRKRELNADTTKLEYWLKKTNGDIELAKKLLSERQSTFSLKKCVEKYGEENGKNLWLDRQEKWHKSFKKSNFSKVSQELFWEISKKLETLDNIYFAQLSENKKIDISGKNNELRLKLDKMILPDFIDIEKKKIIEFDGTYWHGKIGHGNKEREEHRDQILINSGYTVLHINEFEYKNNKQGVIEKCINFLTQ